MKRYARTWQENIKNSLFLELKLEGFSTDKGKIEFCKVLQRESKGIKKKYNKLLGKIKDIRQHFSTAITTGSRPGKGKIILEKL